MRSLNLPARTRSESLNEARGEEVRSPCVRLCGIDAASGWCVGCQRTLDEIVAWSKLDNHARREVLAAVAARRETMP